ncbi:MAG: restriction endonuclease [Bacilli bacterium]|nr:restriction endonuclease [Bacilli bacterium]
MNVLIRGILESARYSVNLYDDYKKNEALKQKERYLNDDFDDEEEIEKDIYDINKIKTGDDFEVFLEMLFKKLGYDVVHCGGSGDQGADLILKKNKKKYVVQAKYYASSLDNTPVQEVCGAIKYYNADKGIVVTNSKFTSGAIKLADANDVKLIDGIKLKGLINKAKKIDEDMLED